MGRYLYVSADLGRARILESHALDGTTERHAVRIDVPPLAVRDAPLQNLIQRDSIEGAIVQIAGGVPTRAALRAAGDVLGANRQLWMHWPTEGVVERIDDEKLRSLWRHWFGVHLLRLVALKAERLSFGTRRLPAAVLWAYKERFPVESAKAVDCLHRLYEGAKATPFRADDWTAGGIAGTGVYLRADFWNRDTSGGSYGHTCYVAKELAASTDNLVALVTQRFELLDRFGVHQIVMEAPAQPVDEHAIATATNHYYTIVKSACQAVRAAYIYERLVPGNYAAAMASRYLGIPYIIEYNGSELSIQKSFKGAKPFRYRELYFAAEAFAFRQATLVSVVSSILKDELVGRGVDAQKIIVNPNGADLESYKPADEVEKLAIRRELGFEPHHRVIGFTATFGGWHGVDVLASALPRICEASPDNRFLLIGDGINKPRVDDEIARNGLETRVHSAGRVAQAEGARLMKACDLYVAPHNAHMVDSKFFGSPTKVFEYMAMGGGIVASALEQMGQVLSPAISVMDLRRPEAAVVDERAVLCVPGEVDEFAEAVIRLADRPDLCKVLGANSRRAVADHYSWRRHVENLWSFARKLPGSDTARIETGERYKDQAQEQWNNTPVGSERVKVSQPHTLEWFREIEADRYGSYAPWMPAMMEFASHSGEEVLEVGGGLGIDLSQFAQYGAHVTDLDLSARHLALAEEHFRLRRLSGRFVHHDGETLPFGEGMFDLVYSNGVIHHTPNTATMVREMYRVLKPGGRVIAMVYAEDSLYYWRNIVYNRGVKENLVRTASMGAILSQSVELSGTDARPLVKVYTRERLKQIFKRFTNIQISKRQLRAPELPWPLRPFRPALERAAGWNLILKAVKPQ